MRRARLVVALGFLVAACDRLPTAVPPRACAPLRGVTLVDWSRDGYGTAAAATALAELAATGANTVVIVVTGYQARAEASQLRTADPRTPSRAAVATAVATARGLGLQVALKPHVDVDDGTWRGRIAPANPAAWFESYRDFVVPWAACAESAGVFQFVAGTELAGTVQERARWGDLVRDVRAVFSGEVAYAASWDEIERVTFWAAVDRVGIDAYFPIAGRADAGRFELLAGWQPWLDRLAALHARIGRPILFTEIGYRSADGAGMHPYDSSPAPLDLEEQADLYWAALQVVASTDWIEGFYAWDWPADGSGGEGDTGYALRGKPAAAVLSAAWGCR